MKKRLLFITGIQIFPAQSGGQMRSSNLAKSLSRNGYEVFVYSYTGRKAEYLRALPSGAQRLSPSLVEYVDRSWLRGALQFLTYAIGLPNIWFALPFSFLQCPTALREKIQWAEIVLVDFPFHLHILERHLQGKPRLLNSHNVEHEIPYHSRWVRANRIRRWVHTLEQRAGNAAELILACGKTDSEFYRKHSSTRVIEVPNALDPNAYVRSPVTERDKLRSALGIENTETVFLFTGSKYGPNREAFETLRSFWDAEKDWMRAHQMTFLIVGSVAARSESKRNWKVTGFVQDTAPYFQIADFALNTVVNGSGTNVKMFEYLAFQIPILSTEFGTRGFVLKSGVDYIRIKDASLKQDLLRAASLAENQRSLMAESAFRKNRTLCDMDAVVRTTVLPAISSITTSRLHPTGVADSLPTPIV